MTDTSKNPVTSVRLPELTRRQIAELTDRYAMSMANVLTLAIDRMYQQEIAKMTRIRDFGAVTYVGTTYTLTVEATLSNRVFPGWWGDAQEGEPYTAEYVADAVDANGDRYQVYWQFDAVKGEEPADESEWPFDDAHVSQVRPQ